MLVTGYDDDNNLIKIIPFTGSIIHPVRYRLVVWNFPGLGYSTDCCYHGLFIMFSAVSIYLLLCLGPQSRIEITDEIIEFSTVWTGMWVSVIILICWFGSKFAYYSLN